MTSKPYDTSVKRLIAQRPEDFAAWLGYAGRPVQLENVDLSLSQPSVDALLRIGGPSPLLLHIEAQVSFDADLEARLMMYHALLHYRDRERLPVKTVVLFLRPRAAAERWRGQFNIGGLDDPSLVFRYEPIRLWRRSPIELLSHPGTMPLATLADLSGLGPEGLAQEIERRLQGEPPIKQAEAVALSEIFAGLRPELSLAEFLLRRFPAMKESASYQWILEEGRVEGRLEGLVQGQIVALRETLLELGRERLGEPSQAVVQQLEAIDDPDRLRQLVRRVLTAQRWDDLLGQTG